MAKVSLQRARIAALVGQGEATGVPKHVRVWAPEAKLGSLTSALHKPGGGINDATRRSSYSTNARVSAGARALVSGAP
jgi:hypothetical protein